MYCLHSKCNRTIKYKKPIINVMFIFLLSNQTYACEMIDSIAFYMLHATRGTFLEPTQPITPVTTRPLGKSAAAVC
jgi:hypothetical protein